MLLSVLVSALLAAISAAAAPQKPYTCHPFTIPIPVNNVTTVVPPFPELADAYQATYFANLVTERAAPTAELNFTTLTKTFTIEGAVCAPKRRNANTSTLHLATHGLGFNRSYWDFYLPSTRGDSQYSYVHAATAVGYTVLTWNRLGIHPSSVANPYTEIQASVELSVLMGLTTLARKGKIRHLPPPKTVIHVGHSYGSELTLALAAAAPTLSDGLVLTGFSALPQYQSLFVASTTFHLANQNQPKRFPKSKYSNGFLTWPDKSANQYSFLAYPNFDPRVLEYAEASKFPFTVGELISAPGLPLKVAPNFRGPVLWVAGEHDLIFCGGNCVGLFGRDSAAVKGSGSGKGGGSVETCIVKGFGHAVNLHREAREKAFAVVMEWVGRKF